MSALLDALGWVGESLDKPGRAVRGLLAGRPGELANLIPFSDTMGLTDPTQSVSGRGLLEQYGALGENQEGLDFGDIAGFGVEMALDPTNWISGKKILSMLRRTPGPPGAGVSLKPRPDSSGTSLEAISPSGKVVGEIELGPAARMEQRAAQRGWPEIVGEEETVGRVFGTQLDPEFHGLGLGQQMYLDAMNRSPVNWFYNSGNSDMATQAIEALRKKGLAEVHWDQYSGAGGPRIMRITPEGRAAAEAGSVLKPGPGTPVQLGPLLAALGGLGTEQLLAHVGSQF